MPITAVFFDIGETLVSEQRLWNRWANYLGVPPAEFMGALDEAIAADRHHRRVLDRFKPGLDVDAARRERAARGDPDMTSIEDLYPDAVPCVHALREAGYLLGIAGNQPAQTEHALKQCGLNVDLIATSSTLGVAKPSPLFFEKLATMANTPLAQIAYVGDRLDNDVLPARDAGMVSVFLQRGPWGRAHARRPEAHLADVRIKSLDELPDALARIRTS